jgi:polygalacturonase
VKTILKLAAARARVAKAAALVFFLAAPALAQDTRKVSEPVIPPACATLKAAIGRAGGSILPEDENKLDTARIQAALDACPSGQAVVLQRASERNDTFLSGPLELRRAVALVVAGGAYLFASRNPRDYDRTPGACGVVNADGRGCKPLISGDGVSGAGVMGDGVIDGRGGETLLGKTVTWWNLADAARNGGAQNNPRLIVLNRCDNFTLYRITLMNSPNFHVSYSGGNGFTAWGVKIWSPERARNTDGIDPGNSTNVTITRCYIHTGDDQVAIKAGRGAPTTHMSIVANHFYTGHGMSIGSETNGGASDILVSDLSIDGADNGLRIKSNASRGGLVERVTYQDVCMRNTANPVYMDSTYSASGSLTGNLPPTFRDIALRNVRVAGAGKVTLEGLDEAHRLGMRFDNVTFDDPSLIQTSAKHAALALGPGAFNLNIAGEDVSVSGTAGQSAANSCADRFTPFPMK